jgi:hypothetical protein
LRDDYAQGSANPAGKVAFERKFHLSGYPQDIILLMGYFQFEAHHISQATVRMAQNCVIRQR